MFFIEVTRVNKQAKDAQAVAKQQTIVVRLVGMVLPKRTLLDTNLIVSSLRNVTNPSVRMVARLVVDTQKADMHSTGREHWYLKFDINGRSAPWFRADSRHEVNFGTDLTFRLAGKSLDTPNNGLLFRFVLGTAKRLLNLGLGSILWYGNLQHHVCGVQLIGKVCNNLEVDCDPINKESNGKTTVRQKLPATIQSTTYYTCAHTHTKQSKSATKAPTWSCLALLVRRE